VKNPYEGLNARAFWRSAVAHQDPNQLKGLYTRKWEIPRDWKIATAGSCFAQHISRYLARGGFDLIDMEPAPPGLPAVDHTRFGFSMYSARFGNIYTLRQLLQLVGEVAGTHSPGEICWEREGRFFDALRPGVEPEGLDSPEELLRHRVFHLECVGEMLQSMDLLIFTLGLTEAWVHRDTGTVFPTVPGGIAGGFDPDRYRFYNASYTEIMEDFSALQDLLLSIRGGGEAPRILLTVSPVPLTATASGEHVLGATIYSKSVLRAVAGQLSQEHAHIDYFPSFEIISNPAARGQFYAENLRSVRPEGVEAVMALFFSQHGGEEALSLPQPGNPEDDLACEEALLEAFAP
jgi:hypothetical protein